ncbi:sigma 54-interacting transcriptional regulator [uncultured Desulfobacter sp.]|uniref:sigma-54-dependent transcriptional regulator n=1 Tax=uncultured Desulfobacter sp. TaxID=240139 RepID=UPI0029F4E115|nr:sigma 54-interacting transcriptional regulator [uncultured Desulfobacter sp.]
MKEVTDFLPEELAFFKCVHYAGAANPFGKERVLREAELAGVPPDSPKDIRVLKACQAVGHRLSQIKKRGRINLSAFKGEARYFLRSGLLFHFFHLFRKQIDTLITRQLDNAEESLEAHFAPEALTLLRSWGFDIEESRRFIALAYQFRRAYYFIFRHLVGRSRCMQELRRDLWQNVFTHDILMYDQYLWDRMENFSTLLFGETGTGKGTAALAMGRSGYIPFDETENKFTHNFVNTFTTLNISQFPETIIESELFGHVRGAFTGAVKDHKGVFSRCSPNGSILLDEIGELSTHVQIKLLNVLQDRVYSPVGSDEKHRFNGRIIAATNRSIQEIREKKIFRDDFYYRLCSDIITVPPLHKRIAQDPEELSDLLAHTVARIVGQPSPEIVSRVLGYIESSLTLSYPWPGNVRELEQCVRRVILRNAYDINEVPAPTPGTDSLTRQIQDGQLSAQELLAHYCTRLYKKHGTYEAVSRTAGLDRRTVKKYIDSQNQNN